MYVLIPDKGTKLSEPLPNNVWELKFLEMRGRESLFGLGVCVVGEPSWMIAEVAQLYSALHYFNRCFRVFVTFAGSFWRYSLPKNFIQCSRSQTLHRVCLFHSLHEGRWTGLLEWLEWRKDWDYLWRAWVTYKSRALPVKVCGCSAIWQWPAEKVYPCLSCLLV